MTAVLPTAYLAVYAALSSGAWAAAFAGYGFAVPGDLYGGDVPETAALPYLRLDGETERESALAVDKRGLPHEVTQSGTVWAASRHVARLIAAAAVARLLAPGVVTVAGHRVLRRSLDLLDSLPPNPREPGVHGAAFRVRLLISPAP